VSQPEHEQFEHRPRRPHPRPNAGHRVVLSSLGCAWHARGVGRLSEAKFAVPVSFEVCSSAQQTKGVDDGACVGPIRAVRQQQCCNMCLPVN
jgi:hypothetical protein